MKFMSTERHAVGVATLETRVYRTRKRLQEQMGDLR